MYVYIIYIFILHKTYGISKKEALTGDWKKLKKKGLLFHANINY